MSRKVDTEDLTVLDEADLTYLETRGQMNIVHRVIEERKRRAREGGEPVIVEVDEPYTKWKVEDLREELKARELPSEGNKQELVGRLEEHDAQQDAS
jgi:hypothetical protein